MIMDSISIALSFFLMPLFLFTIITLNTFSSYASHVSYTYHCASMVPNSTPKESKSKVFPHGQRQRGYFLSGGTILPHREELNHITLQIKNVHETDVVGILNIEAKLLIRSDTNLNHGPFPRSITFSLEGFWSESLGKLCMVGTEATNQTSDDSPEELQRLEIVLKLYNVVDSSNTISTLITGSLESISSENEVSYFEPISVFIFPTMDYEYSLDTKEAKNEYSDSDDDGKVVVPGLDINEAGFCSNVYPMINGKYDLQYQSECNSAMNHCSPIEGDANQLPYVIVSLKELICSDVNKRVRVLIGFGIVDSSHHWFFNPNATLIGEGWWNEEKNQLCINACFFLGMEEYSYSMASVHVGDCSTRMILRFPKIWSINDASSIVGQIWSNKTMGDKGYFKRVILRSHEDKKDRVFGIKYEYTKLEKVAKLCPRQEPVKNKGIIRYPDVYSSDMRFGMSGEYSGQRVAWGHSVPIVVNDQIQHLDENSISVPFFAVAQSGDENLLSVQPLANDLIVQPLVSANSSSAGSLHNVSYRISLFGVTETPYDAKIGEEKSLLNETMISFSAEGVYDAEAGTLCMIGCRNLGPQNQIVTTDSMDCEILVKFQFQVVQNEKSNGASIKGSVESTRNDSDSLYFHPLNLTSFADCNCSCSFFCQIRQILSYCSSFVPVILCIPLLMWPFP